jgi:hypothetical protein
VRVALLVAAVALAGCHSYVDGLPITDDGGEDLSLADLTEEEPDATTPPDLLPCTNPVSCVGLCGPVYDSCLGKNVQCGVCAVGKVCNLVSHVCEVPKKTCAELNATCGIVRNSCGTRLNCPDCNNGQECDPDTHQCVTCKNISCGQLGYECGFAWLGCGGQSNVTDCGPCSASGTACNPFFNKCEPTCTPPSVSALCAAAKTARNVECGVITDGCGAYVDCGGCPPGMACGAQGEPNRCQPKEKSNECLAAGRECGDLTSECGGTVNCGTCTAPDVCNPNGKCGPPCTPKTCAQVGNPACGGVDDGCGGQKFCNDCPNATEYVCIMNMCCKKRTCAVDYAGKCGTMLDDGCGGTVNCGCASGACTTTMPGMQGTCCVNTAVCPANACNTSVTNTCTGAMIPCNCPATSFCNNGTCMPRATCASLGLDGTNGKMCSNGGAFDDGSGTLISCPCTGGRFCIGSGPPGMVVTGTAKGMCCTDTSTCVLTPGLCTGTRTNTCTGQVTACGGCAANQNCQAGMCVANLTCAAYTNRMTGSPCSNGPNPNWPNGAGTNLTCTCLSGVCITSGPPGPVATGGQQGTCCVNTAACAANSCNTSVTNTCTGAAIACNCPANKFCQGNTCVDRATCTTLGKGLTSPVIGAPCNDNNFYNDGSGTLIRCPCLAVANYPNRTCTGDTAAVEGSCQCAPTACAGCNDHGTPDGCNGTRSCACAGPAVCFNNACCTPKTCANPPAGVPTSPAVGSWTDSSGSGVGGACGAFNNGCGSSFNCGCPTTNPNTGLATPNMQCVPVGGSSPPRGTCTCIPTPCTVLGVGTHPNNGCGRSVMCSS